MRLRHPTPTKPVNTRGVLGPLTGLLLAVACLAGCGGGADSGPDALATASPEIRELWNRTVVADQANEYVAAVNGYRQILRYRDQLTEEQTRAVEEASGLLNQRLVNAALDGDAAARRALDTLGAMDRSQPQVR